MNPQALATGTSVPRATLADLLAHAAALKTAYPDRTRRIEKAVTLLLFRPIERGDSGRVWWVGSETNAETTYAVSRESCSCRDWQTRGGPCGHQLAVELLTRLERHDAATAAAPTPAPDPADAPIPWALTEAAYAALDLLGEIPDLTPQCPRCGQEAAVLAHPDRLGVACISAELYPSA